MLASATVVSALVGWALSPSTFGQAPANERLCDNAFENCRDQVLYWINNEPPTGGIDVSFWVMTDHRYSGALVAAKQRGVPIRVLVDLRADPNYPANASRRQQLIDAGIPIRHKTTTGINHWKMMLYKGDLTPPAGYPALPPRVHFSGANFANGAYSPEPIDSPYQNYVDEAIYFTDDEDLVQSFMTKYDDIWVDTVHFQNLANVGPDLLRSHPIYPLSPDLNFPPDQDYQDRVVARLKQEFTQVDAVIFRITSRKIPDELIKRVQAGVPVRLITDQNQYRTTNYFWHSYNVDRMYMAGVDVKWKDKASGQDMHQKSLVLHGIQTTATNPGLAVFGSSNWTASSSDTQREHNYFTTKAWFINWLKDQFNRKWNNQKAPVDGGGAVSPPVFLDFEPGWPEKPVNISPQNASLGVASSVALRWEGGWWAHMYDIYFGTTSSPPLVAQDFMPGSATAGVQSTKESFNPCTPPAPFTSVCPSGLQPGTTYYWRVRGKTMAGKAVWGDVWSFTTSGLPPPPPPTTSRILADAYVRAGQNASTEYGTATELIVKKSSGDAQYEREAYIKLDISAVQPGDTVRLRLSGRLSDTRSPSVTTSFYAVANTTWDEETLNWSNKPAASGGALATVVVSGTSAKWYEANLTDHVQARKLAGASVITIALKNPTDTPPYSSFGSRESANRPELLIGTSAPSPAMGIVADAYVRAGPYASTEYGTATELIVKKSSGDAQYEREAYIKLDISAVQPGDTVRLRLSGRLSDTRSSSVTTEIYAVSSTSWAETSLNWSNKPAASGEPLATVVVSGTSAKWYEANLTAHVQARKLAGASVITIALVNPADTPPYSSFGSRESANRPELLIDTSAPSAAVGIVADAYVRAGSFASANFGSAAELITKFSGDTQYRREAFLKLDISGVQADDTVILRLFGRLSDTRAPGVTTRSYAVADTSWAENSLTWNNRPATGTIALGTIVVSGTAPQWYEMDLTSHVQAARATGATVTALALKNSDDTLPYSSFSSRESANGPQLVVD